ncbi:N-acetyltransferase family protein [Actinoplanes sp. CA-142083]|uniref:GNAT family N-acetyltransferase n=1 Tax=Actinoplanes sp. CA-142083 TaxID=3239903 RepID=UPI003D8AFA0F
MSEPMIKMVAERWQAVAAGGTVAGVAGVRPVPALMSPGAAELSLHVEPEWRRRGIGSRLLTAVREQSTGLGLLAGVAEGSPGEAFCRRHGFRHTRSQRHDLLTYCDVHQAWLGELVDAEHPGYRLTHWTGDLNGTPRVDELWRTPSRPGRALLTAADADGDLAAYAVAVVGALAEPRARQYGPAVLPGHRGRRLGLWVNAGLIQRLREVHPHVTEIEAATAEDDHQLLAAREHFGFRPVGRTHLYELWNES